MNENPNITINFFIFAKGGPEPDPGLLQRWAKLSPREREIALLAAKNLTNRQIAGNLIISSETVKSHIRSVLRKLDLGNKGDLIYSLASNGLAEGALDDPRRA